MASIEKFSGFCPTCGTKATAKQTTHPKDERNLNRWFWLCTNKGCDKGFIVWENRRPYDPEPIGTPYYQSIIPGKPKFQSKKYYTSDSSDSDCNSDSTSDSSEYSKKKTTSHKKSSKSKQKKHNSDHKPTSIKKRSHHKTKSNSKTSSPFYTSSESDSDSIKRKKKKKPKLDTMNLLLKTTQENSRFLKTILKSHRSYSSASLPNIEIKQPTPQRSYSPVSSPNIEIKQPTPQNSIPILETTLSPKLEDLPNSETEIDVTSILPVKTPKKPAKRTKKATPAKTKTQKNEE
jgi:hypothetical protein